MGYPNISPLQIVAEITKVRRKSATLMKGFIFIPEGNHISNILMVNAKSETYRTIPVASKKPIFIDLCFISVLYVLIRKKRTRKRN